MSKILYLDCFSGISGDMFLGMLVDMGVPLSDIETPLRKLSLPEFQLSKEQVSYNGITGTKVHVKVPEEHAHRHLQDIMELAESGEFSSTVISYIESIFTNLAESEAKVHGTTPDKVHFHEVGAMDSIIDIFGCAVGLELLGVDKVISSPVHTGTGFINCQHGKIPVPAPATLEILSKRQVPVYSQGISGELCTPTGASFIASLSKDFGPCPAMNISTIGYGAGNQSFQHPNMLRGIMGYQHNTKEFSHHHHHGEDKKKIIEQTAISDRIYLLQANLDDMNPEFYSDFMDKAYRYGALDVWFTPCQMKKQRPGTMVEVICPPNKIDEIREIMFSYTTTLGIRSCLMDRVKLNRCTTQIDTSLGEATFKLGMKDGVIYNWAPEYESVKSLANQHSLPIKEVYQIVSSEYSKQ